MKKLLLIAMAAILGQSVFVAAAEEKYHDGKDPSLNLAREEIVPLILIEENHSEAENPSLNPAPEEIVPLIPMEDLTKARPGLVVLIDQETLRLHVKNNGIVAKVLGVFGIESLDRVASNKWDSLREEEARKIAFSGYAHFYSILGADTENETIVETTLNKAFSENTDVDVVFMFHSKRAIERMPQIILNHPQIRLVLNEGCRDGDGSTPFIKVHGAMVSIGHNDGSTGIENSAPSASPYHTFKFLRNWSSGLSLNAALKKSWAEFLEDVDNVFHYNVIKKFSSCDSPEEAKNGTLVQFAHRGSVDPDTFTIKATCSQIRKSNEKIIKGTSDKL